MIKFVNSLAVITFFIINEIVCTNIQDALRNYYDSDVQGRFQEEWKKYKHAFENEIATGLRENFHTKAVNIYQPDRHSTFLIADGFHLSDGVVDVYFHQLVLRELPTLLRPKLTLELPSNYIKFESKIDRTFVDSTYYAARNSTSVIYARPEDQINMSPFSLQQVDNLGKVVIIAEDCTLSGLAIATLSGDSVDVGHSPFLLSGCVFTVEISAPKSGTPPVIAPYFPEGPKEKLELLISQPIREELHVRLQGAMNSFINTSVLFGSKSAEFRKNQHSLYNSYAGFITDYIAKVNQKTLKENKGRMSLPECELTMVSETDTVKEVCTMAFTELLLYGLDTAYVTRSGGPYKDSSSSNTAADNIMFSSMQIRGKITHDDGNTSTVNDFAVELKDISVNIVIVIDEGRTKLQHILMSGWKSFEFSIIPWETTSGDRHGYQSLVYGHVLNELPARVVKHLESILGSPLDGGQQDDDTGGQKDETTNANAGSGGEPDVLSSGVDDTAAGKSDNEPGHDKNKKGFLDDKFLSDNFFSDDGLDKDFFSEDGLKKDFFSDDGLEKDFLTDDGLKKDFLTDDGLKKDFISGVEDGKKSDETLKTEENSEDISERAVDKESDNPGVDETGGEGLSGEDANDKNENSAGFNESGEPGASSQPITGVDDDKFIDKADKKPTVLNPGSADSEVTDELVAEDGSTSAGADNIGQKLTDVKGDGGFGVSDEKINKKTQGFLSENFMDENFFSDDKFISDNTVEGNVGSSAPEEKVKESSAESAANEGDVGVDDEGKTNVKPNEADNLKEIEGNESAGSAEGSPPKVESASGVDVDPVEGDNLNESEVKESSSSVLDKKFLSDNFFSDDAMDNNFFSDDSNRRSISNRSDTANVQNSTNIDDKPDVKTKPNNNETVTVKTYKQVNATILPLNVHNIRRKNMRMSENEIR